MLSRRRWLRGAALSGAALTLAACGFRPLYGGGETDGVAPLLAAIEIDAPGTRLEQAVRNELVFLFTNGRAPAPARYRMTLGVTSRVSNLVIEQVTGRPTASSLTLSANVVLTDTSTGAIVLRDTFSSSASFEQSTQRFANERAQRDAGDRAARDVAARIRVRTATALRSGS